MVPRPVVGPPPHRGHRERLHGTAPWTRSAHGEADLGPAPADRLSRSSPDRQHGLWRVDKHPNRALGRRRAVSGGRWAVGGGRWLAGGAASAHTFNPHTHMELRPSRRTKSTHGVPSQRTYTIPSLSWPATPAGPPGNSYIMDSGVRSTARIYIGRTRSTTK